MSKLNIALIGNGKMGRLIEQVALQKKHAVVAKFDSKNKNFSSSENADIYIDFSHPDAVLNNISLVAQLKKNIVIGTTGWYNHLAQAEQIAKQHGIGLLYAPNFSLGVNLFFKMVQAAAEMVNGFEEYDAALFEAHHNKKADSPSGTALAIAEILLKSIERKKAISTSSEGTANKAELQVSAMRCGHIPGTHTVVFDSLADTITLTHAARNREGFAHGAVLAAEWLVGKKGIFTMEHILGG